MHVTRRPIDLWPIAYSFQEQSCGDTKAQLRHHAPWVLMHQATPPNPARLEGRNHLFRVYAALRDDPFYNNPKGLLTTYQTASTAIKNGAPVDAAGCAHFDQATAKAILSQIGHTDGGPAQNLMQGVPWQERWSS